MQSREKEVLQRLTDLEARVAALESAAMPEAPEALRARVLGWLPQAPGQITRATLYRKLRLPAEQLNAALAGLAAEGLIGGTIHRPAKGRPVELIWRVAPGAESEA